MRKAIADTPKVQARGKTTASIGAAQLRPGDDRFEDILSRAKDALTRAQKIGRGKVEFA